MDEFLDRLFFFLKLFINVKFNYLNINNFELQKVYNSFFNKIKIERSKELKLPLNLLRIPIKSIFYVVFLHFTHIYLRVICMSIYVRQNKRFISSV